MTSPEAIAITGSLPPVDPVALTDAPSVAATKI